MNNSSLLDKCLVRMPYFVEISIYERITFTFCSVLNAITAVAVITGNALILVLLLSRKKLRTKPNILLGSLATTDLLTGISVQPMFTLVNTQFLFKHTPSCSAYVVYDISQFLCGLCSSYISILVTSDRCFAISHPFRHRDIVTKRRIAVVVSLVWLIWSSLMILRLFIISRGGHFAWLLIISFFLSFCVVVVLYIHMLRIAKRHQNQIAAQIPAALAKNQKREGKAMKTASYIIGAFILCYMPYIVARIYCTIAKLSLNSRYVTMVWVKTLLYMNSCFNPFILFWRIRAVRKALLEMLSCR